MPKNKAPIRVNRKASIRAVNEILILKAAEEIFANYGFRGASTSMIAQKAGVPKSNVHHYFGTKDGLYRQVLEKTNEKWEMASELMNKFDEPIGALTAYIHRKMDLSRENYFGSKVWAGEIMQGAPLLDPYLKTEVKDWTDLQVSRIRKWIAAGKIDQVEPFFLLLMIWSVTQHYADFEHQISVLNDGHPLSDAEFEDAKSTVTRIILKGIGASV